MTGTAQRRRGVFWFFSLGVTALIAALLVLGALSPDAPTGVRVFGLAFGGFLLFVVVRWVQLYIRPPRVEDGVLPGTLDGERAVVIRMRSDIALNALVATALFSLGLWAFGIWYVVDRGGNPVLPFAVALVFTWFVPDALRIVLTGGRVIVSPSTIEVQAWDATSRMSWDDLQEVRPERNGARGVLRLTPAPGATTWQTRRRRWLKRYDPKPPDGTAEIFVDALAIEPLVLSAAIGLWQRDPASRADIGTPQAVVDLGGIDPRVPRRR